MKASIRRSASTALFLAGFCVSAAGCTQMSATPQSPQPVADTTTTAAVSVDPGFSQIRDLPIPPGATMNIERTFIVGSAESWYGQTMVQAPGTSSTVFEFYKQELPSFSWQELSSVRAGTSVLTYTRDSRVLAIQLTEQQPGLTEVMITVSPRGGDAGDLLQPVQ